VAVIGEGFELEREESGAVFVLRLRAGENRVNRSLLDAFSAALDEVESSQGPAALVSVGEGRFYSNGLDIAALKTSTSEEVVALMGDLERLFARLLAFPVPTVAALNGHAFAAGAMIALAHDFRVMREDRGYLCLPEIDLATGRPLTPGMFALLEARLGPVRLHEMLVTGHRYPGPECAAKEIVHEVAVEDAVLARAIERAAGLAEKHRPTLVALKRGLYANALRVLESDDPRPR
jgi:enoyl-CoA hydratase/carnithine racemase